jgi:hypothetical protein
MLATAFASAAISARKMTTNPAYEANVLPSAR